MNIVLDIDGTLADISHRLHFIKQEERDWESFSDPDTMMKDTPIKETWEIIGALIDQFGHNFVFSTGRKESVKGTTREWIQMAAELYGAHHKLRRAPLYMRADDDHRPSDLVKKDNLDRIRADGFQADVAFEDRLKDAQMYRKAGLRVFHVANGGF